MQQKEIILGEIVAKGGGWQGALTELPHKLVPDIGVPLAARLLAQTTIKAGVEKRM